MDPLRLVSAHQVQARRLRQLARGGNHGAVLEELRRTERARALDVPELLLKGRSLQLDEGGSSDALAQAELTFLEILRRDPENIEANLEMGWLQFAVFDDAARALPYFEKAHSRLSELLREATRGLDDARADLSGR